LEAAEAIRISSEIRRENFESDFAVEARVESGEDLTHATPAEE
jgi:hypothetical protein